MFEKIAIALGAAALSVTLSGAAASAALRQLAESPGPATGLEAPAAVAAEKDRGKPERLERILDELVKAGTITEAQKNAILEKVREEAGKHAKRDGHAVGQILHGAVKVAADFVGVPQKDLLTELRSGKSLAEIAVAHGKTRDGLIAALTAEGNARIDKAKADGKLTAEQAAKAKAKLAEQVAKFVDRKGGARSKP